MRPSAIRRFESLYLLAIAIEIARVATEWSSGSAAMMRIVVIAVSLGLVFLVSRYRQTWAALVLGLSFLLGLSVVPTLLQPGTRIEGALVVAAQLLVQALALISLATPPSRAWLAGRPR